MNPGSAVPAWLQEILPPFFIARPALTEALWAAAVAVVKSAITVLSSLWAGYYALAQLKGFDVTPVGYWHVIQHGWFIAAVPLIWGLVNGRVAQVKSNAAGAAQDAKVNPSPLKPST